MIKLIAWNVLGANKSPLHKQLSRILGQEDPDMIALLETRLTAEASPNILNYLNTYLGVFIPALSQSGGLVVFLEKTDRTTFC